MKNRLIYLFIILFIGIGKAYSDEGMYLLTMLEKLNLEQKGLAITADQIYSINQSCIKDAIVGLGTETRPFRHFCTGEIVSDQGLMLTNHHCGFGYIQSHSSVQHDYLTDGFWAMTKEEELPNEGLTVSFLIRIEDVTEQVLQSLNDTLTEEERNSKIAEISMNIEEKAIEGTLYKAHVSSMFEGNQYFLYLYEIYKDVRLVGAPPSSIGKFGGDTDNWMWPRHTGDFSVFRVYSGPDGKPATYAAENIPLKPKYHLPVSLEGYNEGDYMMIVGYPGTTTRYLTSQGINEKIEVELPARIKARTEILTLMKEDMDASDAVRIQYASKYYRISNGWKYFIGQRKGLQHLKVYEKKKSIEGDLTAWIVKDEARKEKYGEGLPLIDQAYEQRKQTYSSFTYLNEALFSGHEIILYVDNFYSLLKALKADTPDQAKIDGLVKTLKDGVENHFKDYNVGTDKKILKAMMTLYFNEVPKKDHPDVYNVIESKHKGDINKYVDDMYKKTIFASKESITKFLEAPSLKVLERDPAFVANLSFSKKFGELNSTLPTLSLNKGRRLFLGALMEMNNDKIIYPDANSTMRLSYGFVGGYNPADAVTYEYYTTTEGILEKEDSTNEEFIVDPKLKELVENNDYGDYSEGKKLNTCFLGNLDSTGGNSGTGVLNKKGELIGLLFDGNWEAMSGDIYYETTIQKSINVDIRYVLFVIDKVCGAKHLVDEMTLVKSSTAAK